LVLAQREGEPPLCGTLAAWWRATVEVAGGEIQLEEDADPGAGGEVLRARADDDRMGVVHCDGQRVGVGIAPDLGTARRIAAP
jgi:hypothetical protein